MSARSRLAHGLLTSLAGFALASLTTACGSSNELAASDDTTDAGVADTAATDDAAASTEGGEGGDAGVDLRGQRYCEVLLVTLQNGNAHIAVYNTIGLNDCPLDVWKTLDATKLKMETGAFAVELNGPRHWTLDGFDMGDLIDPTPRDFDGLSMRQAGAIDIPVDKLSSLGMKPYTGNTVQRSTVVHFDEGKLVYELVDPSGAVYDMQSWSDQKKVQTEAELSGLASRLTLPTGWSFRARTLPARLEVTAVNGMATIIQDDLQNSYQLSAQHAP